ncbi:hypothetical protein LO80_06290 [Candidatus Francisella endociliophora]|uniref:Uncharacterized protein n=1 Tax=Candidatus Francisella endociliophora TaxID=653937 RepID=A0A097EPV7_9GAMM|nr:hypothetical protein [Francisella sp. FSC1006]AIT09609.1 hypothetical protein LO80_06290 [Francisella sp. FSC1006]
MQQSARDNLQTLFESLKTYYLEEQKAYTNRAVSLTEHLSSIDTLASRSDFYNLSLVLEEVNLLSSNLFSKELIALNNKIKSLVDAVYIETEVKRIFDKLELIKVFFEKYLISLQSFFVKRVEIVEKINNIEEFVSHLKSKADKQEQNSAKAPIVDLYLGLLKGNNIGEILTNNYKRFFSKLRSFVKQSNSIKSQLPLKDNPIIEVLQLAYFIKNNHTNFNYTCYSDSIFLNAYQSVFHDDEIESPNDSIISFKYKNLQEALDDNNQLKQIFEYGFFAVSQYFNDFNLERILLPQQRQKNKFENSFKSLVAHIERLPNTLKSLDELYFELNKKEDFYSLFISESVSVMEISPANILSEIANIYFHKNLNIASFINFAIYENKEDILSNFKYVERLFMDIATEISKQEQTDLRVLKSYIMQISTVLKKLDEQYEEFKEKEQNIVLAITKDDFTTLNKIYRKYQNKNYKEIISNYTKTKKNNIQKMIAKVNKYIKSGNYEKANIKAKEVTYNALENSYYNIPKLICIDELPPVSHSVINVLQNRSLEPIAKTTLKLNEEYWRV